MYKKKKIEIEKLMFFVIKVNPGKVSAKNDIYSLRHSYILHPTLSHTHPYS